MSEVTIRISAVDNASQTLRNVAGAMDGVKTAAGGTDGRTGGLAGAMGKLGSEIQTAVLGFGAMKLTQTILDMRDLGQNVDVARQAFIQLNGGTREAEATLGQMRAATRGVVDDYHLMAGANRLLLMELAGSGQEAARLTEIAVTLGRVMGKDAAQSIEDFSLLLSNRSIPRLDNFGISAANVRERIEELKEAGYGLEDAFTMAVLEEGERSLRRLGDTAGESATAWDTLGVKIANVKDQLAGVVFQAGETLAQMILIVDYAGRLEAQRQQAEREAWAGYTQEVVAATGNAPGAFTAGLVTGGVTRENATAIAESMGMTGEQLASVVASVQAMQQEGAPLAGLAPEEAVYQYQWLTGQTLTAPVQQAVIQVLAGGGISAEAARRRTQELVTRQQYGWGSQRAGFAGFYEQEAAAQRQLEQERAAQTAATRQEYGWGAQRAGFAGFYEQEAAAQRRLELLANARIPTYAQPADLRGTRVYGLGRDQTALTLAQRRAEAWTPTTEQQRASQWALWNLQQGYGQDMEQARQRAQERQAEEEARNAERQRIMQTYRIETARGENLRAEWRAHYLEYTQAEEEARNEERQRIMQTYRIETARGENLRAKWRAHYLEYMQAEEEARNEERQQVMQTYRIETMRGENLRAEWQREWMYSPGGWRMAHPTQEATTEQQRASQWALWNLQQSYASVGTMGGYQERRQQEAAQWGIEWMRGIVGKVTDEAENWVNLAGRVGDAMDKAAERAQRIAGSLGELLTEGRMEGVGGDIIDRIAAGIEDEAQRQRFLRETGRVTGGEAAYTDVERLIMGMGEKERITATNRLVEMMSAPGFALTGQTTEGLMHGLGYRRTGGGPGYTVRAGDTIWGLSRQLGIPQEDLMRQLGITDPRRLQAGAQIGMESWEAVPAMAGGPTKDAQRAVERMDAMIERLNEQTTEIGDNLTEAIEMERILPIRLTFDAALADIEGPLRPIIENVVKDIMSHTSKPVGTGGATTRRGTGRNR